MLNPAFRFGLEGEYLLVDRDSYRPLWHPDLTFAHLNAILESIPYEPLLGGLSLEGLELDPPHRRTMPYYVEGYGLPDPSLTYMVDVLPKGLEIRTPICPSLEVCLQVYEDLYQALQQTLGKFGYRAVALSHHPTALDFRGPQNHRRHDWWQWGMQAMTTYGPDLNLSVRADGRTDFDWERLQGRTNYYAPALVAFSLASPVECGRIWKPRGRAGLSLRTYRRSLYAPAIAAHPKEQGRLEFKTFDMPADRSEFYGYFLLWVWLVADDQAPGWASDQDRVYDLGAVARFGWDAEEVRERAEEVLDRAGSLVASLDFDPSPLRVLRERLQEHRTPADALIDQLESRPSVPDLLRYLDDIARQRHSAADSWTLAHA